MAKQSSFQYAGTLVLAALLLAVPQIARSQSVTAVPNLDDTQFSGTWYEIARSPNKYEKVCLSDVFQLVARGDKLHEILLVSSCKTKQPDRDVRNFAAKAQDKLVTDGRLKITTLWPFSRKYWVLALGPKYEWSLIGSPNHKFLWIYSRTPTLAPAALAQIEAIATSQGFPSARLVFPPPAPETSIPAALSTTPKS